MRTCLICLETKELNCFSKDKRCKEGRCNYCIKCMIKRNKEWRNKNREHYLEYEAARRDKDREAYNQRIKKYNLSDKGRAAELMYNAKRYFINIGINPTSKLIDLKRDHLTLVRKIRHIRRQRSERKDQG